MLLIKKYAFSIPFLIVFIIFCLQLAAFFQDPPLILSIEPKAIGHIILATITVLLTSMFFLIAATLAQEWKVALVVLPAIIASSLLFLSFPYNIMFAIVSSLACAFTYFLLQIQLKTYFSFHANHILIPLIKHLVTLLLFAASICYFISANENIKQHGFTLPPSLLDAVLQISAAQDPLGQINQLEQLKQNPQLLKELNISQDELNQLTKPQNQVSSQALKAAIGAHLQNSLKPYLSLIPFILAFLFFITIKSLTSLFSLFLYPLIWFIFYVLEKVKVTTYTVEMREVKKLVV